MRVAVGALTAVGFGLLAAGGLTSTASAAGSEAISVVSTGTSGCTSEFCFEPGQQASTSGDTVTWTNTTGASHTVTRCDTTNCSGQGPGTGADTIGGSLPSTNSTYGHTFSGAGTYFYYCSVHGYSIMHGEVDVAAAPPLPEAPSPLLFAGASLLAVLGALWLIRSRRSAPGDALGA